jgi:hypothetical protein
MKPLKFASGLFLILFATISVLGQGTTTGSIKGRVKTETGSAAGVTVTLKRSGHEVGSVETNRKGDFAFGSVRPGTYSLTFRKAGLAVGILDDVEVIAGKVNELKDGLIMKVDEGAVAFVRGSVFTAEGRSVPGARVEISRINGDGSVKKIDTRITTEETGQFVFRLPPMVAKYRVAAKINGLEPIERDVQVDGPAVYRVALTLKAADH